MGAAFLFIEGLTVVCLIGTVLLWGVFGFLYVAERHLKKQPPKSESKSQS